VPGATACDGITRIVAGSITGVPGDLATTASMSQSGYGAVSGDAQLSGPASAPVLSGSAASLAGKRSGSSSAALQRYVYTGSTPTTRSFRAELTYDQVVPAENAGLAVPSQAFAAVEVFRLGDPSLEAGATPLENWTAITTGYESAPGYVSLGLATATSPSNITAAGSETLSVSVTLNPGDTVWVISLLQALTVNGAAGSASLATGWDDASGLQPAHAAFEALLQRLADSALGVGPGDLLSNTVGQAQRAAASSASVAACGAMRLFDFEVRLLLLVSQRARRAPPWAVTPGEASGLLSQSAAVQVALGCRPP
jgi:hypothetical protein